MLRFALRNLRSRPVRSGLALAGLTVAIGGMVGLFSVAEGLDQMVGRTFERIPGMIVLQRGAPIPLFSTLPASWGREIAAVPGVHVVNPEVWQRANLIEGKMVLSPPRFLFGIDLPTRLKLNHGVYRERVVAGRFLTLADRGTWNTLVSRRIARQFHKDVGDTLEVNGRDLHIVGIYDCGSLLLDVAILLDIDQVRAVSRFDADTVSCFYVEPTATADREKLAVRIDFTFRGRHLDAGNTPGDGTPSLEGAIEGVLDLFFPGEDAAASEKRAARREASGERRNPASSRNRGSGVPPTPASIVPAPSELPVEVQSSTGWEERFDRFSEDLDLFLTLMTGIGVTIAVLSIVNTMLMSVTERVIEFGILKANGWSQTDVLKLITCESAVLGFLGGILGCGLGWSATLVVNAHWPDRIHLYASPTLLLASLAFSVLVGIAGGLYPALWAMRLRPMDAIRWR